MIPNCGILTESIKELGKKHGITNEIYLKALYTRWATMHTNDEVFDDKALLEEMSLDAKKVDTIHLKEFGVIPSHTPISGEAPGGKISGVNKEGNIKLYKDSITGIEDFLKSISGKTSDSITSQQKKKVFEKLSKEGKDLRYFEDLLKSKKDILAFVLFHEKSHIAHRDSENYDVQDLLGDNQIEIEYRATLDAIEEFKAWKENESKKVVPEKEQTKFNYARYSDNAYEVSSSGDSRFSAKYATFKEGTVIFGHDVSGRTIESVYQNGVKQGDWITDSNNKTGAPKSKDIIKGNTEDASYYEGYLPLWQEWARQNPELIEDLRTKASGKTLTDKFASTAVSQARALADILNSSIQSLEQPTQQSDELPEDIIIKPSPVSADEVTKRDLNTPRAKLNSILPDNIQKKRSKLIAKMFYDICNEHIEAKKQEYLDKGDYQTVLEWDSSAVGRAKALRYIDVKSILEEVYQSFIDNANVTIEEMVNDWRLPLEVAEHRKKHYTIIVDNFAALLEDACPQIEKDCGLRLCITANQVNNGKIKETKLSGTFVRPEDIYDTDPNMQDNEDGARSNGNDGWSYKARHTDPHSTISLATKNILRQLPRKDSNGDIIYDDLGNEELIDEEFAHAMLIQGLSGMITSEDFCVITQTENGPEYDFPALQQLALKYPWVEEVIDYLINNPTEIAAFYTDFRNTFIPYYKFKNGKLVAMNQGTTNGSSLILQVKRDYEQGNPLTDNPIYTTMSESNIENIEINKELLKEIQDDLTYADGEDSESLKPVLEKTVKLIRALGFDVDYNDINALWHTGSNNSVFNNVLSNVSTILSKAANAEPSGLITMLNSDYIEIAKTISKVLELENLSSFREGDKTYYSYSAPNFADIQIAYFKSDKYRDDYLTENFKQFKWFTDNEGNLRDGWLKLLATDDYIRQNLETIELKNIDGVDYEDWTGDMIDKAFIGAYFSKYGGDSAVKFAYYHYPIFSDSPVAKFIKMPRYSNIKEIIPLLREVVKQELYRIDHVNKRASTKGISKIGNYDKVGRKFCFFPDLNDYKVGDKSFLDACNEQYANEAKQNEIIDSALEAIMERNFLKFKQDTAITAQDLKNWGVDDLTVEEALKEYYYNSVYAETQIIQMTVTDLAYYKDATDFQKRFKEVYAAGKRLYTGSQYGKKFENVIYLADNVKTSTVYDRFKKGLNKALEAGRITKMDYDSILYKFRNVNATDAQGFRTHESYRAILDMMGQWTPVMEDALNKMIKGEWDMSHFNVVWQTIKPFLFSTTIKPDGLGDIMKVNHQNKDSEFLLLAVMDMIAADANSPQIKVLNQFMLDNNIDLALYESGCKAGKQGVIDLNYNQAKIAECKKQSSIRVGERVFNLHTDRWNPKLSNFDNFKNQLDEYLDDGTMLQEEYNKVFEEYLPLTEDEMRQVLEESVKTKESQDARFNRGERPTEDAWFNPNVVHTFSYEDYMIAQPTPEHLIDAETIFGSQFRNLIISDLPANFECTINGVKYNRKEVHDLYNSLIVANLVDSFNRLKGDFNNIHTIQQRLLSMVQGNPKYGRDIIQALEIVKVVNPLTGQEEEVFNIPLNNPSTTEKLQQLILSAFKNGITKQYIHGGNAILVSDIGYTKELNVVKEKDGTLVGIECYLPATSKAFFEPLLKTVTNTETGEAYQILDFNELDDDLKRAIGYRIPTEQKYSMVPLIIKGFLPQQNGSSIMVAEDVTTLSGCDFDVDKMFLMLYNFIFDEFGNPKKLKPRKPAIGKYKDDADAVSISKMSKEERDNLIIDLSTAILTHPDMAWVSSKPGSYDNLKRASRVAQILENAEMFEQFKKQYGVTTSAEISAKFKELPLLEDETDAEGNVITQSLENFVKEHKATMNPLELTTFKYFHRQNMTGGALVGIYANNTTMQAKYQETSLWLKEEDKLKINDTDYTSLTSIYSKDSKLISFNCAETSAASVDNGKDPVLADLMQNKKTAKVLGMLLRAGIPIDDATMVFNLPNVREVIYHTGSLDGLESRAGSLYVVLKSVLGTNLGENPSNYFNSVKNNNISSDEIIDFIIEYRNKASRIYSIIYNNELDAASKRDALIEAGFTIEEVKTFIKKDLDYSIIVNHYHTVAKDLGEVTRVSRADSPNGAIKHTIQEAVIQKRDVDLLHMGHKKTTIQGLHNVIRNDFITGDESVERMIEMFINHGTPRLQAFYTFGIDLPLNMISKYFVQTNPWMTEKTKELFDQAFVSFGSKGNGKLDPKILKYFYNGMMHYCLSSSRLFGTDSSMTFEEKRDWYIYEFPKEFINLRNKYTQLNNHSIIGRLEVRKGVIEMLRAGRLTETQRLQLSNSITSLLQGDEIERQLATDLLIYAYHSTGLNFGPNNYGMFFDTTFYNQFPEFVEILRTMQFKVNEESGLMKNFMDQFYAIYGTLFTFKVYSSKNLVINDSTRRISISKDRVVNTNIQQQKGTKEPWRYITAVYDVEEVNEAGETIKVSKRVLFKLVDGDSAENATYERIGSIYDPFTGHIRYNANRTAEQLSIDVNSEGALKKAEEQRSVNYKRGAKYEYKGRPINDRNAMDNAFAFVESDSALEVPDYFDSIPDVGDVEYGKLEASAEELDKLSLEENIANELDRDYSDDEIGIHMPDDYGTFLDGLSDVSAENLEALEKLDERQLSVLDNIESYMDSIPEQDYGIEEGLNELEEKMC